VALRPGGLFRNAAREPAGPSPDDTGAPPGPRPGRRPLLLAVLAWLLALAVIGYLIRNSMFVPVRFRLLDLDVYRDGGQSILHTRRLYAMRSDAGLLFTYPPAAAVLAVPLALMSFRAAQYFWLLMVYVPLVIVGWISFRPLLARAGRYAPAAAGLVVAGAAFLMPLRQEVHYGQVDIFLVALCLLDCVTVAPRWPRGALIGLATAIKLVPGVFIIYLLITGRRKAAGVAALSFGAVSGVTYLIAPQDSVTYWSSAIFDSGRLGQNTQAANQSLRGMILRLFAPAPAPTLAWLLVALAVAVAGFAAARAVQRRGQELGGVAITGLLAALLSPVAWIHHLCWVVIVLGVIIGDGRDRRRVITAGLTAALFASVMPIWGKNLLENRAAPIPVTRFMEATFGLAALVLIGIVYAFRPTDADLSPPVTAPEPGASAADGALLAGSRQR
jgi:alpha-1,2-mannosyltransferase